VVLAGMFDHFEIWDEQRWTEKLNEDLSLLKNGGLEF